jgi:hypothetical protein
MTKSAKLVAVHTPSADGNDGGAPPPRSLVAPKTVLKTLSELGPNLPIGVPGSDGALSKSFSLRELKTRDERELAKLRKGSMSSAQYVGVVMSHMLTSFGPHVFGPEDTLAQRHLVVNRAFMGDIFYAYLYLRREVFGADFPISVRCLVCENRFGYVANLDTVEVRCVEHLDDLAWEYELRRPLEIRRTDIKKFRMLATRWASMESDEVATSATGKVVVIRGAITGINDDPAIVELADSELDDMSKLDLEHLVNRVNDGFVGPRMAVADKCPKCETPFLHSINWQYDDFFSVSSR